MSQTTELIYQIHKISTLSEDLAEVPMEKKVVGRENHVNYNGNGFSTIQNHLPRKPRLEIFYFFISIYLSIYLSIYIYIYLSHIYIYYVHGYCGGMASNWSGLFFADSAGVFGVPSSQSSPLM